MISTRFVSRTAVLITLTCILMCPKVAFSQALPWQSSQGGQSQQQPTHPHHHNRHNGFSTATAVNTRDADDRMLNLLASKFYGIHETNNNAIEKLKKLEQRVKDFRTTLQNKSAEADILKDAQNLERRITRQRKQWEERRDAAKTTRPDLSTIALPPAPTSNPAPQR